MRFLFIAVACTFVLPGMHLQALAADDDVFGITSDDVGAKEAGLVAVHPDGDVPHDRMLSLVHTDALPRFNRMELYAVSFPDRQGSERPKKKPTDKTFPVWPYEMHADIHAHVTLTGESCDEFRTAWRSLDFDSLGGAFCHFPAYGFRLYRDDQLLFETTVCWECQNFYLPQFDAETKQYRRGWYGFANNRRAKMLLKLLREKLPHPKL